MPLPHQRPLSGFWCAGEVFVFRGKKFTHTFYTMNYLYRLFLIGLVSFGVTSAPFFAHASPVSSVYISEVGWAGSSVSASDEFLELFNPTSESVSLSGWSLQGAGTTGETLTFPEDAVVSPHTTYLITNYAHDNENSARDVRADYVTPRLALPNTKLQLALVDAVGTTIDMAGDGTGSPAQGRIGSVEDPSFASMTRVSGTLDGSLDSTWTLSVSSMGFKNDSMDFGTPQSHQAPLLAPPNPVSEPEPSTAPPTSESSPVNEAPTLVPIEVAPATSQTPTGVITVMYQGYVFELNLPESDREIVTEEMFNQAVIETDTPLVVEPATPIAETPQASTPENETTPPLVIPVVELTVSNSEVEATPAVLPEEPVVATTETEPTIIMPTTLHFSTLYPNTLGDDALEEYVTLENFGVGTVDLLGWSLRDASGKTWTADGMYLVSANTTVTLPRTLTNITLNNSNETIELLAPNGTVIDSVSYTTTKKGVALLRGTDWNVSEVVVAVVNEEVTPTAPEEEIILTVSSDPSSEETTSEIEEPSALVIPEVVEAPAQTVTEPEPTTSSSSSTTPSQASALSIAEIWQKAPGSRVMAEGFVTVTPGNFTTQTFYLEDESGGIQVYLYSAQFPDLATGDHVRITGVISEASGEHRIKLASTEAVTFLDPATTPPIVERTLSSLSLSDLGRRTTVEGTIVSARSDEMELSDENGTLLVIAKSRTGLTFSSFHSGDRVRVTGIVLPKTDGFQLAPRFTDDLVLIETLNESPALAATVSPKAPPSGRLLYGALFVTLFAIGATFAINRHREATHLSLTNA